MSANRNPVLPTLLEETSDDFSKSISMSLKDGEARSPTSQSASAIPVGINYDPRGNVKQKLSRNSPSQDSSLQPRKAGPTARPMPAMSRTNPSYGSTGSIREYYGSGGSATNVTSASSSTTAGGPKKPLSSPSLNGNISNGRNGSSINSSNTGAVRRSGQAAASPTRRVNGVVSGMKRTQSVNPERKKAGLLSSLRRSNSANNGRSSITSTGSATSNSNSRSFSHSFKKNSSVLKQLKRSSSADEEARRSAAQMEQQQRSTVIFRGYKLNDIVLARTGSRQVNMYGYPPGEGIVLNERQGPYEYVVAKVKQVHFEEITVFYTLTAQHNGLDLRGDVEFMKPIRSKHAEEAALRAANDFQEKNQQDQAKDDPTKAEQNKDDRLGCRGAIGCFCYVLAWPFLFLYDLFVFLIWEPIYKVARKVFFVTQGQARLLLNGERPYQFSARVTSVNLIVLCTAWYMFIDQARLAFFPADADDTLATVNFVIWVILTAELLFEVFIRPDGYSQLVVSDKAFAPETVRFVSGLHLIVEVLSLAFFVPEFLCLFTDMSCDSKTDFSFFNAALIAVIGPTRNMSLAGRAFLACIRLRVFGLVRHWKNMWINTTFIQRNMRLFGGTQAKPIVTGSVRGSTAGDSGNDYADEETLRRRAETSALIQRERDAALINASNIGTALMVTNSYRALMILCAIIGLFPLMSAFYPEGSAHCATSKMIKQIQQANILVDAESEDSCDYLVDSVEAWFESSSVRDERVLSSRTRNYIFSLAIQPQRCEEKFSAAAFFLDDYTVQTKDCKTLMDSDSIDADAGDCLVISLRAATGSTLQEKANSLDLRVGAIQTASSPSLVAPLTFADGTLGEVSYAVHANFNQTYSVESSALLSFLLQVFLIIIVLGGLSVLRGDAEALVLNPLRSMLRIVARYAKNPLASTQTYRRRGSQASEKSDSDGEDSLSFEDDASDVLQFSNYETEQLITAVSKITDLLRKCWGVAGADIIATNLATREGAFTEVFNPTVPGRSVYALFAFAAIQEFDHAQKCLEGHVMSLINDVAAVVHGEVYRWGFGDSGQCNKNLGGAFLMVFRIGLVKEVIQKLKEATNVIFSTAGSKKISKRARNKVAERNGSNLTSKPSSHNSSQRSSQANLSSSFSTSFQSSSFNKFQASKKGSRAKNKGKSDSLTDAMQLSLQSLPGISTFTDRAVMGMLKSFAGIHRDKKLRQWSQDFRLSAGVGTYAVNMVFGMDAGWAVEGAVGSEYKIDATYLSPHVNMASRMMSACKHYGVTLMLSEAVQELMSDSAKGKLRNLDRVTVKGSSRVQKIFTYDARHKGANFFLLSRQDDQADLEAERYVPSMWNTDQDLLAMRQHIIEDFEREYTVGLKAYYDGDWPLAIEKLEIANEIMVEAAMEEDETDDVNNNDRREDIRCENADGPSLYLLNFMKSQGGVAPEGWDGWHPLLSK